MLNALTRETPDIETASEAYARRFAGAAGRYLLGEQEAAIRAVLAGFRGGTGPVEILAELRFLPSSFDQGKLPLRGLAPQDQAQNDLLFTIGVTIKP